MPLLPIRIYDDPVLRATAQPIAQVEERHRLLARDMAETMYEARGIGLAANQVGVLERVIIVDVDWSEKRGKAAGRNPIAMFNPEILEESVEDDTYEEGCLSLPEILGDVWRPIKIRYRYLDQAGRVVEAEAEDLQARCIQHEIDHLNGVLFIDHMEPVARQKLAGKLAKLRESRKA